MGRLIILQIVRHGVYKAWAEGQQSAYQQTIGPRGKIFFSGGQVLAADIRGRTVSINSSEIEDKAEAAKKISAALNIEESQILDKINKSTALEKLKNIFTEKEIEDIKALNLSGVYVSGSVTSARRYPQNFLASHVLGFLGGDGAGQYGIEGYYDDVLKAGESFNGLDSSSGGDVYLSLDYNIQFKAEKLLEEAKTSLGAESGQIIVMDPITGKILAMAGLPNYDPNNYSEITDFSIFQNPAVQQLYEPGSIFKPITMAAAIDKSKITPDTKYVDAGVVQIGGISIYNYDKRSYGERTMTEVLERSINTGAVFAERKLGNDDFMDYVERFGFFDKTGITLDGEVYSDNKELKKGYEVNFCTASFGQGIEITPLQMMRALSAIAAGGRMPKPYIVERTIKDGKTTELKPEAGPQVISPKAAAEVVAMMVSVIENGFSKKAKIGGYYIAGKSGTAQVPWTSIGVKKKGYSDKTWQSFVGFAPAYNPQFIAMVKLDNPKAGTAEYSAMPIFKTLSEYLIDYLRIPPDYAASGENQN